MANQPASSGGSRSKPLTRSSLRQSLNLASMGKALADVMNKDTRDAEKAAKKSKESSLRRLSAINPTMAAPRSSIGDAKAPTPKSATPDSKTITRKRLSAVVQKLSSDENPTKSPNSATQQAGAKHAPSLRPRPASAMVLPKYRPKSAILESGKNIPSPPRAGTRKRPNSSDEDKDGENKHSPSEKATRPISPLPHRALKVNLSSTVNSSPSTPPKTKSATPVSTKGSPSRPTKAVKTAVASSIPRPPSASSSSSSFTPRTPKTPSVVKNALGLRRTGKESPDSPLSRQTRTKVSASNTPINLRPLKETANMSHISEGNSEDSIEADDVALLLAPVASLAAPTPAMPRMDVSRSRQRTGPETPTRTSSGNLPSRAHLSYLSPLPPDSDSPPMLRPPKPESTGKIARGSILSWEQLATEASRTLGEGEIEKMIADIPAPFRSGAVSPSPSTSHLDIPESPCLSAISSPGQFGSISQILLPEVTPSPAVHNLQRFDMSVSELSGAADSSVVTLLRLQLASAESMAKERLQRLQELEEELHNVKTARHHEAEELTKQVVVLEEQMRGSIALREKNDEERNAYTTSLEEQLRHAQVLMERAVEDAIRNAKEDAARRRQDTLREEQRKWERGVAAREAASRWVSVHELAESELELVRGSREMLSVLLMELDRTQRQICPS